MNRRHQRRRQGVVLLITLSILVLFVLLIVTFIVIAGHQSRRGTAYARAALAAEDPRHDLDAAFYQVLRGAPRNTVSAIGAHSLLEDLYGYSYSGRVTGASISLNSGGQLFTITLSHASGALVGRDHFYAGCVLTIAEGRAAGMSTRVLDYTPGATASTVIVEAFPELSVVSDIRKDTAGNTINPTFVLSGRPFSGTGVGYNTSSDRLNATVSGGQTALLPNFIHYAAADQNKPYPANGQPTPQGSLLERFANWANESWDAPDTQNMFMSYMNPGGTTSQDITPSYHRPALYHYWVQQGASGANHYRRVSLRPLVSDHQDSSGADLFTGSNAFATSSNWTQFMYGGPWDVDNDRDLIPDSVWLDLGFPVQRDKQGRTYKKLFAILVRGLDGRLNVNAHGSLEQSGSGSSSIPTGTGEGPADIYLGAALGSGVHNDLLTSRYGSDGKPGASGTADNQSAPLNYKTLGERDSFYGQTAASYLSPADPHGEQYVELDHGGWPQFINISSSLSTDNPYEMSLLGVADQNDEPFTAFDLERLLRPYDADRWMLSDRLESALGLTSSFNTTNGRQNTYDPRRNLVTTHSSYVPIPAVSLVALMQMRVQQESGSVNEDLVHALLPPEVFRGQRFNLNRPWGDGEDNNGNGVVDEPGETNANPTNAQLWNNDAIIPNTAVGHQHLRQIYARYLYSLMMLLMDQGYEYPSLGGGTINDDSLKARRIAQWAVNVVDFRDPDGIMTPFVFDIRPFNGSGWGSASVRSAMTGSPSDVSDSTINSSGELQVVFGAEHPDLLITETMATHDKRLRDTDNDTGPGPGDGDEDDPPQRRMHKDYASDMNKKGDQDLDQHRVPQGSLFIELFCPRGPRGTATNKHPLASLDLYDSNGNLLLNKMAGSDPVWRIVVTKKIDTQVATKADTITFQPEQLDLLDSSATRDIERVIWFTNSSPTAGYQHEDRIYWNRSGATSVAPRSYFVVAPRGATHYGIDEGTPPTNRSTQALSVSGSTFSAAATHDTPPAAASTPAGMVCAADGSWGQVGISVSEPLPKSTVYYPQPSVAFDGVTEAYGDESDTNKPLLDEPLDYRDAPNRNTYLRPTSGNHYLKDGLYRNFRAAMLQRLANPLVAYNPVTNPYITVDYMSIDLRVLNSDDEEPSGFPSELGDWDQTPGTSKTPDDEDAFQTRERGPNSAGSSQANIWSLLLNVDPTESHVGGTNSYFDIKLEHTLGWLNQTYGSPSTDGLPSEPFPWITWHNRPFKSPHELMNVHAASPNRLGLEFTVASGGATPPNYYSNTSGRGPLRHMLRFYKLPSGSNDAHFFKLFDFVEIPSRFRHTSKWYSASTFASDTNYHLRPPFNRLSRFRDPGRININMIGDAGTWEAVSRLPSADAHAQFVKLFNNRRGFTSPTDATYEFHNDHPSRWVNRPFRDSWSPTRTEDDGIDAGLLRRDINSSGSPTTTPLLADDEATDPKHNTRKNPYFQHLQLQNLGGKVGTQTNVYAIWITVGYFEVTPTAVTAVHPDGYKLGQELGMDTNDVRRHRAFYMVDRSIPVGFSLGQNLNVDKTILLKRYLD